MSAPVSEEEVRLVARTLSAAGHELAGPLQTALNALFVLERARRLVPPELAVTVRALEESVELLRSRLARLLWLPESLQVIRAPVSERALLHLVLPPLGTRGLRVKLAMGETTATIDARAVAHTLIELIRSGFKANPDAPVELSTGWDGELFVARVGSAAAPASDSTTLNLGVVLAHAAVLTHGGDLTVETDGNTSLVTLRLDGARL